MPVESLLTFTLASVLLVMAPGPDILFVMTQSALYGARKGIMTTAGLCTGLIFHTTAVAFGVAVIFKTSEIAFTLLKIAGAVYLLYLAWQAWHAAASNSDDTPRAHVRSGFALYRRGILMNITNPKVSLFFLAFLPQFTSPEYGNVMLQTAQLGAIFMLTGFVLFCGVSWSAASLSHWLMSGHGAQKILNRVTAGVFTAMAAKLAVSSSGS